MCQWFYHVHQYLLLIGYIIKPETFSGKSCSYADDVLFFEFFIEESDVIIKISVSF